jgi:hypothetical protein
LSRRSLPLAVVALVASTLGCGAQFDPASELQGLRVLAVRKSAPYAQPGTTVDLQMLWHDSQPDRPPPQIAWLASCQNPPADLFEICFSTLAALSGASSGQATPEVTAELLASLAGRVSLPSPGQTQANDRFSFTTAPDIISSRPVPKDPTSVPYGVDFVLFAACAGTLELRSGGDFPLICYDNLDGEPGLGEGDVELGSNDFVVGYSAVFAYDELQNQNPLLQGVRWGDLELHPEAVPVLGGEPIDAPALGPDDLCIGAACQAPQPGLEPDVCPEELSVPVCADGCPEIRLRPLVDPASAELDSAAAAERSNNLQEQMWVNFYASHGKVTEEVRLLNDAVLGWSSDPYTDYEPADEPAVAYLWAVAHDNRGGSEWARLRICLR